MKKAKYECTPYYEAVECGCGGIFVNSDNSGILMASPPRRTFLCNNCGESICLQEQDWPQMRCVLGNRITDA